MLRQQEVKSYKQPRKFEDLALYQKELERIPIEHAMGWSVFYHSALALLIFLFPLFLLLIFGINLDLFNKIKPKPRDIEFVLVNQPEEEPINKKTPLRADRNTRAGGIHDPNKKIAPPQQALPKSAPSQQRQSKPKQVKEKTIFEKVFTPQPVEKKTKPVTQRQPVQKPQKVTQPQPQQTTKQEEPQKVVQPKPAPPKPMAARPSIPPTKAQNTMKLPIPPSKGAPRISTSSAYGGGPVSTRPTNSYGGSGTGSPKPVMASGGYGQTARIPSNTGSGRGSAYSPGGGNVGNPGPGNPHGRPGVDAIKEPNFGPYMSELSRRIKSNWDPPRGDESKRVVLFFKIAKDGRLLNVKVLKSSGTPAADKAAVAAVELTAPFRPLPAEYREASIDIQFTFDYNVFGVNRY